MNYIIKLFGLSSLFYSKLLGLGVSGNEDIPENDSLDIIYDELSSGEDYWGDASLHEMEIFCCKMNLISYSKRLGKLRESLFKPSENNL